MRFKRKYIKEKYRAAQMDKNEILQKIDNLLKEIEKLIEDIRQLEKK